MLKLNLFPPLRSEGIRASFAQISKAIEIEIDLPAQASLAQQDKDSGNNNFRIRTSSFKVNRYPRNKISQGE